MDAVITAGGTLTPDDPLYALSGVEKKALLPLAGQPMICWVIDALRGSGIVDHIAIVGLEPKDLNIADDLIHFVAPTGNLLDNILAGMYKLQEIRPALKKFLLFSSDIPLITPEIVRGFVDECGEQDGDLYYSVIEERTMEARFPASKRTYVPFKGGRYCGGDAFLLNVAAAMGNIDLARALIGVRKNYFDQLRLAGWSFIIRFLLRRLTVHQAAREAMSKTRLDARVVDTKFAELGMDLDKPRQYEMIKAELEPQHKLNRTL